MAEKTWKAETIAVQGAYEPGNGDPRVVPLALSTTFAYDSAQDVADLFDLKTFGHFYTRLSNPTVAAFEGKMCIFFHLFIVRCVNSVPLLQVRHRSLNPGTFCQSGACFSTPFLEVLHSE